MLLGRGRFCRGRGEGLGPRGSVAVSRWRDRRERLVGGRGRSPGLRLCFGVGRGVWMIVSPG